MHIMVPVTFSRGTFFVFLQILKFDPPGSIFEFFDLLS